MSWLVGIVVDPNFREMEVLVHQMPVWAVDTNRVRSCLAIVEQIELHHPCVFALEIIGVSLSETLTTELGCRGYRASTCTTSLRLRFIKSIAGEVGIPTYLLNAKNWKSEDHVYDAIFEAIGAPSWHGRNFDALRDSIYSGAINRVEVPYRPMIENNSQLSHEVQQFLSDLALFIKDMARAGCSVDMTLD